MTAVRLKGAFVWLLAAIFAISGWHSFHNSEVAGNDDMSIDRYSED